VSRRRQIDAVKEIGNATVTYVSAVHVPKPLVGGVETISKELW
jgi:hypothetical protein